MEALQSAAFGSRSVREAEGMQREREGLQVAPIRVVRLFPARHLGLPRLHPRLGRWVIMLHVGLPLASCQSLLGLLELPLRLSEASANGKRIALDDVMDNMEEIPHSIGLSGKPRDR